MEREPNRETVREQVTTDSKDCGEKTQQQNEDSITINMDMNGSTTPPGGRRTTDVLMKVIAMTFLLVVLIAVLRF